MRRPSFAPQAGTFNFHSPNHPEIRLRCTGHTGCCNTNSFRELPDILVWNRTKHPLLQSALPLSYKMIYDASNRIKLTTYCLQSDRFIHWAISANKMAGNVGLEPTTYGLTDRRSANWANHPNWSNPITTTPYILYLTPCRTPLAAFSILPCNRQYSGSFASHEKF